MTTFANVDAVVLNVPDAPTEELELPAQLETVDEVIAIARDAFNTVKDAADFIGITIPVDFPEGSIYEWFIEPVTGDFNRIAAGGMAAYNAGQALYSVSNNIVANNSKLAVAWTGAASQAFVLNTALYAGVARAAGLLLRSSKLMFDGIAAVSRAAGELLAEYLDRLVTLCVELVEFLGKKFAGAAASVANWFWDAVRGFPEVRALVEDIQRAKDAIDALLGFKDDAEAYYEAAKSSFDAFQELQNLAKLLPALATDPLHQGDEIEQQLKNLEEKLEKRDEKIGALQDVIDERADDGVENTQHEFPQPE